MDPGKVLELVRPLVMVVDGWGTVLSVHGGCGGFLGHDLAALPGTNVLHLVAAGERDDVASYFLSQAGEEVKTALLPLPFRVHLVDADGREHAVDVIPTGQPDDPEIGGWVVVLVPLAMQAGPSRSLAAELGGAPRSEVKQLLAEELELDNADWTTRVFLVDLPSGRVTAGRNSHVRMHAAIAEAIADGWEPWLQIGRGQGSFDVSVDDAPAVIRSDASLAGWNFIESAPVYAHGELVAAYVRLSHSPNRSPFDHVRTNVESRLRALIEVTQLLLTRWRDQDALRAAASFDPLTGLANRETLNGALALNEDSVAVIYIDIDHFKAVNDEYGHAVGDRVLVEVGRRVSSACRRDDVVARVGGDEFVVLLRCVDEVIAGRICRRILDEVRVPFTLIDGPRDISVSIGLAMRSDGGDMVEQADRAMLAAKRQGRARLVLAS